MASRVEACANSLVHACVGPRAGCATGQAQGRAGEQGVPANGVVDHSTQGTTLRVACVCFYCRWPTRRCLHAHMQDVMRVQASLELSNVGSQMSIGVNAIAGLATAFAIGYYLASGHGRTTVRTRRLSVVQPGRSMAARASSAAAARAANAGGDTHARHSRAGADERTDMCGAGPDDRGAAICYQRLAARELPRQEAEARQPQCQRQAQQDPTGPRRLHRLHHRALAAWSIDRDGERATRRRLYLILSEQ